MRPRWKRTALRIIPHLFSDKVGGFCLKRVSGALRREICDEVTDEFFTLLLRGMDLALCLSKDYRGNIKGFQGKYVFVTADGGVATSAVFDHNDMKVHDDAMDDWDVRVVFRDGEALRGFLFSQDQDILNSLLKNEVNVQGNANYIYRYGFLVRDLARRIGID